MGANASIMDWSGTTRLWIYRPCVLLEHPLDVWPLATNRPLAANANAAVRAAAYVAVAAAIAMRSPRILLVGLLVVSLITLGAYLYERYGSPISSVAPQNTMLVYSPANMHMPGASLQYPPNADMPADATLGNMICALQGQATAEEPSAPALPVNLRDYNTDCQTRPWAPVEPTPLFKVDRTSQLDHQLASGYSTGNPIVSPQNPMGNPLTYDYYTAVNMDKPLASTVAQQEYPRFFNSQTEFPEGLFINPVPDPTRMARPVYFPQSSEVGRDILQFLGTGYRAH